MSLDDPRDPAWGPRERALFARYRDLARARVNPRAAEHDARRAFDRASFAALGEHGLYALGVDDLPGLLAALEGLATGCDDAGFAVSVVAHAGVAVPVLYGEGCAALRERWGPGLVAGSLLAAVANAEPSGGTDVLRVRSRARPHGDGVRLSARKRSITNLGAADVVFVSARALDAPDPGRAVAAYVLDARAPGCHQRARVDRMGLWTSPTGDLVARNVALPPDARLCDGVAFFRRCFALERLAVGALFVGALRRAVRRMAAWLGERPALAAHQYVQQRAVRARCALASTEALLFAARRAWLAGAPCEAELSALKLDGAERALAAAEDQVRLFGARGYQTALGAEKDLRDLLGLTMLGGTAELHQGVVFRALQRGG